MLRTKLSIAIALVAALALLVPAAYADEGTTTGSFGAASKPPEVTAIEIYQEFACTNVALSMDPTVTYYAKVTVTSHNKLKHLDEVQATIFYNATGADNMTAPGGGNTHDCAILTCTVGPPATWAIDPVGGGTTWQIVSGSCFQPADLNVTTGDWIFAFTPGKVARENTGVADWDAQGKATNKQAQSGDAYVRDKDMNFYGEITVNTATVDWGNVPLGLTFETDAGNGNPQTDIAVNYIANGDYSEDIKSSDNWTGAISLEIVTLDITGGNPPLADSQFALEANDTSDNTTAIVVTNSYLSIDASGNMTEEIGDDVNTNALWLSLSAAGITPDTYSGSIYYQIANR